jgi:hypothetical protein
MLEEESFREVFIETEIKPSITALHPSVQGVLLAAVRMTWTKCSIVLHKDFTKTLAELRSDFAKDLAEDKIRSKS